MKVIVKKIELLWCSEERGRESEGKLTYISASGSLDMRK